MRIGNGYDVHRLEKGEYITLGGIKIACDKKVVAHSDGDALTHSIIDALIGAMALGDIGKFFPENDVKYKGASSLTMLSDIKKILDEKAYKIINIDSVIVLEKPRLRPHIDEIRKSLADTLMININDINVKATCHEKMGYIGENKAIACNAVVLIEKI